MNPELHDVSLAQSVMTQEHHQVRPRTLRKEKEGQLCQDRNCHPCSSGALDAERKCRPGSILERLRLGKVNRGGRRPERGAYISSLRLTLIKKKKKTFVAVVRGRQFTGL